jgi:hypothetical protein
MSKRYTFKSKPPAEIPVVDDLALINDEKWRIGIRTVERIKEFRLSRTVIPTLNVPLYWNPDLKAFELGYYPAIQIQDSKANLVNPATEDTLTLINSKLDSLDVALSTRASESTLAAIKAALASVGTDKLRTSVVDALPESPFNLSKVGGTVQTGRDWSGDLAKLQNIDVLLSTRASESTLNSLNSKIQSQTALLFVKDVSVGTTAVQIDTDTAYRDEVILLADKNNTADIKVGTSTSQLFPLSPGASVGIRKTSLNLIYAVAVSGTQILHVIAGGS